MAWHVQKKSVLEFGDLSYTAFTFAVFVENKTLLVPLSNIIVRLVSRTDVVFPLTEMLGDASCHVLPDPDGKGAKIGAPTSETRSANGTVGKKK
jgi:hypothetical protein